ncbi:MAG: glycoside hydrolase family 16 protein, partial [Acidobacteria bacterium]|nr:glycoside hydrolase family 16 protein [Acidobacteriota bacterium]
MVFHRSSPRTGLRALVGSCLTLLAGGAWAVLSATTSSPPVGASSSDLTYPVGVPNAQEPSGMAPPAPNALVRQGYRVSYINDFPGSSLPAGWLPFTGVPGGDPGSQFAASHVVVTNGELQLQTWRDPHYNGNWVTGGLCQCDLPHTYGAFFVRSRVTGPGPTIVELLWPIGDSWPPEVDFNETGGGVTSMTATVLFRPGHQHDQRTLVVNEMQWHTYGV